MNPPKKPAAFLTPLPLDTAHLVSALRHRLIYTLGQSPEAPSADKLYQALALVLRDRLMERHHRTQLAYRQTRVKQAFYLSMEYLIGRTLNNALLNLGLHQPVRAALHTLGTNLETVLDAETDAGLGNGGLGRLAACFLESCATQQLPVTGYGIRYQYGLFRQRLQDGRQVEDPDGWLARGFPWEVPRPERTRTVRFGGRREFYRDDRGELRARWVDADDVLAEPFDVLVPGFQNDTVNLLRLWSAKAPRELNLKAFNAGSYPEAVAAQNAAENITMVLYPNDASENGKELRLRQQYFLASASLQDVLADWVGQYGMDFTDFAEKRVFQLNDTHPTLAIVELMRLLIDECRLSWDAAWQITSHTMAYTNHTLLPEALEKWPVSLMGELLPRLLDLIYEINARFLADVSRQFPGDGDKLQRLSLIEEGPVPQVRMAYLAIVGSFSVNGVAALHSTLLQQGLFRDFYAWWPEKFNNKTNGVTPRRWLMACNPTLSQLITSAIGPGWQRDLDELQQLAPFADDMGFRERWATVKYRNKQQLAAKIAALTGVTVEPTMLLDVQVKRIHEYKRQLLNVLHLIHLYDRIKQGDTQNWTPRWVLIGGKAAPGYGMAKKIIHLINAVAHVINQDPATAGLLRVVFYPDYSVSAMEQICAAAELSQQISTAGKEASGTGNMKLMMNGAVTLGTLDGANIEIREAVGAEAFFLFGLTADQVDAARATYDPAAVIAADPALARVMALLKSRYFNAFAPHAFDDVIHALESPHDPWLTLADFSAYREAQAAAAAAYQTPSQWRRLSILNTAASGRFSSDRTIAEYNRDLWQLVPVPPLDRLSV